MNRLSREVYSQIMNAVVAHNTKQMGDYGNTPNGVGWNSEASQTIRFDQVMKILPEESEYFSVNDYGCGYGAFFDYLKNRYSRFKYFGYDVSKDILDNFAKRTANTSHAGEIDLFDTESLKVADYTVMSGVFGMKFHFDESVWLSYIKDTLDRINANSIKGFSFNMITNYTDRPELDQDLYYADPCYFFDYCKKNFSRNIALLHDYSLYDFTILVRKNEDKG